MNLNRDSRVLAIGIDAAEPTFIRKLIDDNQLPTFKSLLSSGRWLTVESPANIGSGSVWPTFITGQEPTGHGVYGEWSWRPETMDLSRYNGRNLKPFWNDLIDKGKRVGVIDVPFAPFTGFKDGFELSEWGPHDLLEGHLQFAPAKIADTVTKQFPSHPLIQDRLDTGGPRDYEGLENLSKGCLYGVKLRGKLVRQLVADTDPHFIGVVFTEIHHSGHYMWHTLGTEHPVYGAELFKGLKGIEPTLTDIYREVDRQVGELLDQMGGNPTTMVFSLHGMRPTHGVPTMIEPLLREKGYAQFAGWGSQSWGERAVELMATAKRYAPKSLKKIYYKTLSPSTTLKLARPTMMPVYDWSKTRAFALPADQHGWLHVNLIGREARGIVPVDKYNELCCELEEMLRSLTADDGRPVVRDVIRTAKTAQQALVQRLPDLVVHWHDAAFSPRLKLAGSALETEPAGQKFTGRHALNGFCILKGEDRLHAGETLRAAEIHKVISRALNAEN
jgi:predicted AlkP superfamily phosphohydrolase/phosphomutase